MDIVSPLEQAEQCLRNIEAALAEAECGLSDLRLKIEIEVYARRSIT